MTPPFWGFSADAEGDGEPSSPLAFGPVSVTHETAPAAAMAEVPTLTLDEDDPEILGWQAFFDTARHLPPIEEDDAPAPGTGAAPASSPQGPAPKRQRIARRSGSSTAKRQNLLPAPPPLAQAFANSLGPGANFNQWLKQANGDLTAHGDVLRFCTQMQYAGQQKADLLCEELRMQRADLNLRQARSAMQRHGNAWAHLCNEKAQPTTQSKDRLTCMLRVADWKLTTPSGPAAEPADSAAQGSACAGRAHTMENFVAHLRTMNPAGRDGAHYLEPFVESAMHWLGQCKNAEKVETVLDRISIDLPNWEFMRSAAKNFGAWLERERKTGLGSWLRSIDSGPMNKHPDVKFLFTAGEPTRTQERYLVQALSFLRAKLSAEAAQHALVKQGAAGAADWDFIAATAKRQYTQKGEGACLREGWPQFFATQACLARWSAWQRANAGPAWSLRAHVKAGHGMPDAAQQAFIDHLRQSARLGDAPHHLEEAMPAMLGLLGTRTAMLGLLGTRTAMLGLLGTGKDPFIDELQVYLRTSGFAELNQSTADSILGCLATFDQVEGSTLQEKVSSYRQDQHEALLKEAVKAQGKPMSMVGRIMRWAKAALAARQPPAS